MDQEGNKVDDGTVGGPEPHWLARLTIDECMNAISHPESSVRGRAISLLRQTLVHHCYDPK